MIPAFEPTAISKHPIQLLELIRQTTGAIAKFEFGIYQYVPQSIEDRRHVVTVEATTDLNAFYGRLESGLNHDQEIALHSRVYFKETSSDSQAWHLPMVDLTGIPNEAAFFRLFRHFDAFGCKYVGIVNSGRSFHVYGVTPIRPESWIPFIGQLLLLNQPGEEPWIDTRWLGHRLLAGYGSLRLSWRSNHYVAVPNLLGIYDVRSVLETGSGSRGDRGNGFGCNPNSIVTDRISANDVWQPHDQCGSFSFADRRLKLQ